VGEAQPHRLPSTEVGVDDVLRRRRGFARDLDNDIRPVLNPLGEGMQYTRPILALLLLKNGP
jgi:hypothetical protein